MKAAMIAMKGEDSSKKVKGIIPVAVNIPVAAIVR